MKKVILTCIIILLCIMGIFSYTFAATDTYSVNMYLEKTRYKQGETIYIPVKIEDVDIEKGIVAFDTIIKYDEDVFESVKVQKTSQWQEPTVIETMIHSATESMQPLTGNQEIMILVLKVKSYAKLGNTQIELTQFDVSDTENTIGNVGSAVSVEIIQGENTQEIVQDTQNVKPNVNIQVSLVIGVVTVLIIILLIVYYVDKRKKDK